LDCPVNVSGDEPRLNGSTGLFSTAFELEQLYNFWGVPPSHTVLTISALKGKSAAIVRELMFTRALFQTKDMHKQGQVLSRMSRLVDDEIIKTTQTKVLEGLSAETLKHAHKIIETGTMIGKFVVKY